MKQKALWEEKQDACLSSALSFISYGVYGIYEQKNQLTFAY